MDGEVVEDHHVAFAQCRRELGLDVSVEGRRVIGPSMIQGALSRVAAQPSKEGVRLPVAKGRYVRKRWPLRQRPRRRVILVLT